MGDVYGQFIGLQQNRQYVVSYRQGIGRNHSSADIISNSPRGNSLFFLRKRIWETFDRAAYTSARDLKILAAAIDIF